MAYDEEEEEVLESTIELGVKSANVASFVALAQVAAVIINGITLVVIARMLDPSDYGAYSIAFALAAFFGALCNIGFGNYLNKRTPHLMARKDGRGMSEMFVDAFVFTTAIGIASLLVGVALSGVISAYVFHSPAYAALIDFTMISVVVTALLNLVHSALIGFGDGKDAAATYISNNVFLALASISLVYLTHSAMGAISGIIVGPLVGTVVGLAIVSRRFGLRFNPRGMLKRAREMFAFSLPIAGGNVANGLVSNFSVPFLGLFVLPALVAPFGLALRLGSLISIEMGFVGVVLIPLFANALEKTKKLGGLKELYNYSIYFGVLITAPIVAYLADFPQAILTTLFPAYASAGMSVVYYIPLIGAGILLGIIGNYGASLAISAGDVRKNLKYTVIVSAVQFASVLALVPFLNGYGLGAYGAIIGFFIIGGVVSDCLYMKYASERMRIRTELGGLIGILLATAVMAAVVFPINLMGVSTTIKLLIGAVAFLLLYPPLLVKTGALGGKELALLEKMGRKVQMVGWLISLLAAYASLFA
jgi:PST family polysaccharide transporter